MKQIAVLLFAAVLAAPITLMAQSATSASITGRVTDDSGAAMPNVAVTVTSPALQVPQVTATTDADGAYRVLDLPAPGVFKVTYSLTGFQTYIRDGLNLSVGFSARVDATMKLGRVEQTIEVVGASPVIDTVNTAGGTTLQQEDIAYIPKGVGMQELLPMAAGVSLAGKPDVGDSNLAARSAIITYGVLLEPTLDVEGINITTSHDFNTATYFDTYSLAEVEFRTSGNNADVAFPGVNMVAVMKSGGNSFHGSILGDYETPKWQGNNITPALAKQGLTFTNPLKSYYDYSGDVGGHIIKDKLWFYTGLSKQLVTQGQIGFVNGPNAAGCWTCGDAPGANVTTALEQKNVKVSWQPTATTKVLGVWQHGNKYLSANGAASTRPFPSTQNQHQPENLWKGELQMAPTPHLLFDALAGFGGYHVQYTDQPGTDVAGNPSSLETSTNLRTGPHESPQDRPQRRFAARANLSYITGKHQFKVGSDETWEEGNTQVLREKIAGDYVLVFNRGVPTQVITYNFPFAPRNRLFNQSAYFTDSWRVSKRLVVNYGVRWERYDAFYPDQEKLAGQFSNAAKYPGVDLLVWKDFVPRVGGAWDVTGSGKTVIKASFGMFGDTMGDLWGNTFNPNAQTTTTYRWTGPCVVTPFKNVSFNNTSCDATKDFLATLNPASPNYVSTAGGASTLNNPDLKQNKTFEYVLRVERQLIPNVSLSVSYVRHRLSNLYNSSVGTTSSTALGVNIKRPYEVYTVPVTLPDGLTGAPVTLFTFPPSFNGAAFVRNRLTTAPSDRNDSYNTLEVVVTKRYSKRWNGMGSFWMTKNHQWIQAIRPTPNDDAFPLDETRNWEGRGFGSYKFPFGFAVAGLFRAQSGVPGQRTQNFSNAALLQGPVTRRLEEFGTQRGPVVAIANLKVSKTFSYRERYKLQTNYEVFNMFNSSAATGITYLTGPTYLRTTGIVSPRVGRLGLQITF